MKKLFLIGVSTVFLMTLAGCSDSNGESVETLNSSPITSKEEENHSVSSESTSPDNHNGNNASSGESANKDFGDTSLESSSTIAGDKELSQYSNKQIEYARVWLQLGPNQEIDELNVRHIPAGTPINSDDDTSASYPENVIQLAGSRLVDGSVTYSGNGDGTINVYNVPLRWDGSYPAGEKFYIEMIENTKLVDVDQGDNTKIIELIKLIKEHS